MRPKTVTTQWDFGDLFAPAATRKVWSVAELTTSIKRLLETQWGQVWVTGEITNLRAQSSGHYYFTLKDAAAQLSCVLFRGTPGVNRDWLEDGRKVNLQGELTVYEPRGQYQLVVRAVEREGMGALQAAFERLKQKLQAEGLFAPERKRPLPRYPQRIGVVTSPTGAALRDVMHVIERRYSSLALVLAPCRVQGSGAAEEIAAAIRLLNDWSQGGHPLDLILVTRGGGSLEDLWAFNEEVVARAIFESALPVVSAVGHEIDFTISDFVADVRAATPSAAAEIITEGVYASRAFLSEAPARLRQLARQRFAWARDDAEALRQRLARAHPRRRMEEQFQRLDDWQAAMAREVKFRWRTHQTGWQVLSQRLQAVRPAQALVQRRERWQILKARLNERVDRRVEMLHDRWQQAETRLRLLSPQQVLQRGYSITLDATTGRVIRAADEVQAGQRLKTKLQAGEIQSEVQC
jgi:exodeoxyribonuclease VII large subunit